MPVTKYSCMYCARIFDSYGNAEECEKTHMKPKEITDLQYKYSPYPVSVKLRFEDGAAQLYLLHDKY